MANSIASAHESVIRAIIGQEQTRYRRRCHSNIGRGTRAKGESGVEEVLLLLLLLLTSCQTGLRSDLAEQLHRGPPHLSAYTFDSGQLLRILFTHTFTHTPHSLA